MVHMGPPMFVSYMEGCGTSIRHLQRLVKDLKTSVIIAI